MIEQNILTVENIIASITLRLKNLDLEISDTKKRLKEAESLEGHSCFGAGYEAAVLQTLCSEEVTLKHILGGIYDGEL